MTTIPWENPSQLSKLWNQHQRVVKEMLLMLF
uniref:Uncharacterized protein n=1 Tax=Rhizophora mucronata TaxID=61149 RepID=A0A2P2PKZ2_RHIMU